MGKVIKVKIVKTSKYKGHYHTTCITMNLKKGKTVNTRPFSQEHHVHEIEDNKVLASTGKDGHTHKLIWKGWTPPRPKGSLAGGLG